MNTRPHNPSQAFDEPARRSVPGPAPSVAFSPAQLQDKPVPSRRWIVEGLIPVGNVTMLAGDGGLGKSLLAMQLLTCSAIGAAWLGFNVEHCRSMAVFCEDDRDELHIRQAAINEHYGCAFSDLSGCLWMPRVGEANVMRHFADRGASEPTRLYREVKDRVKATGSRLVVIDSLHDVFSGNENARGNARQFISDLRALILPVDGAVLLLSHPSMSGMASGTGAAGSTAWHNAVRSRLYLTRPARRGATGSPEAEDDGDPNERILKTMKSNYGSMGGKIALRWERGVFVRTDTSGQTGLMDRIEIDRLVLAGLAELVSSDTRVPSDRNAATGFANALRKLATCRHMSQATLLAAQDRLIAAGRIVKVELGPPSKRKVYLRPDDMLYSGEIGEAK